MAKQADPTPEPKKATKKSAAAKSAPNEAATPAPDDPKERFRQALESKKKKSGYGSESHATGNSPAHGTSGKAGGKREFRRKSG